MTPKATPKPAEAESHDIEVILPDDRLVTIHEPKPGEYGRLVGAQMAIGKIHAGAPLTEADEANVRAAICLLSVTDGDPGHLTEEDMLGLSHGDWLKLFFAFLKVMSDTVTREGGGAPLASPSGSPSSTRSSDSRAAKQAPSPAGQTTS
jgi:hypothetical protein